MQLSTTFTFNSIQVFRAAVGVGLSALWAVPSSLSLQAKVGLSALGLITCVGANHLQKLRHLPEVLQSYRLSQKIDHELPLWQSVLEQHLRSEQVQIFASPTESYHTSETKHETLQISSAYHDNRQQFQILLPAAQCAIEQIFTSHVPVEPILELGSNVLNDKGESYLAELLPQAYQAQLTYSDYVPAIVQNEAKKTTRRYLQIDAKNLKGVPASSLANIVAINVIDTIERLDLPKVIEGAFHALKPGGKMVILADRPFHQRPLLSKYSHGDNVVFPFHDRGQLGVKVITTEALKRQAAKQSQPFARFIDQLTQLPANLRTDFLFTSFAKQLDLWKVLGAICPNEECLTIDHQESFLGDLTQAVSQYPGFQQVTSQYVEALVEVPGTLRSSVPINSLFADLRSIGLVQGTHSPQVRKDHIRLGTVFHAMILQKR